MSKLRVGVIGLGMGRHHVEQFRSHEDCHLVAVSDTNEARLKDVADRYEVAGRYAAFEQMLASESLDIVSVATPNKFHKSMTIAALEAGCHVLCEKPMAMNAKEAQQMLRAARKASRRICINFSSRFTGQSWAMKREVDRGALGDVYYARTVWLRRCGIPQFGGWFGQKELSGGGPLIDLGVHRLDLALWMLGHPKPVWVMGATYDLLARAKAAKEGKKFDVEDMAVGLVRLDNGATLELEASWAGHLREKEYMETRILGTRGGLVHRNLNEGYQYEVELYLERDGTHFNMQPHVPAAYPRSAMHHLVDCIRRNEPHTASGEEGAVVMQILDALYASAAKGQPVKIE